MSTVLPHELGCKPNRKDVAMGEKARLLLAFLTLMAALPVLMACNTARGAGEDLKAAGKTIEHAADDHKP
jgi:predicted small secreted protein